MGCRIIAGMSWSKVSHAIDQVLDLKKSAEKLVFLKRPLIWLITAFIVGIVIIHISVRFFIWPEHLRKIILGR